VESLRPRAQQIVDALIDRMLAEGGPLDLVTAFARPLPVRIICELLGLPSAESEHIRESVELLMHTHGADPDAVRDAFVLLHGELGRAVRERRRSPGDDLISDLIQSDRADEPLTDGELVGLALLLFVTGHETTMTQLASSALALLQDDGQRDALIARPELIGSCVEELLRFVPLGHAGLPFAAAEDLELAGVRIPRGDLVFVSKLSANRDERAFPEADVLDITRSPNRHIAFSHGPHHCLGAALARMEMQVALGSLFSRMPTLRLAVRFDEVEWRTGSIQRGPVRLPVTWED
jgi:nocardicin N-oxygenase